MALRRSGTTSSGPGRKERAGRQRASPAEHHVVEGDAEVGAGLQHFGDLDGDADLLAVRPPERLQAERLRVGRGSALGDPGVPTLGNEGRERRQPHLRQQDGQEEDGAVKRRHISRRRPLLLQHGKASAPALHLGAGGHGRQRQPCSPNPHRGSGKHGGMGGVLPQLLINSTLIT